MDAPAALTGLLSANVPTGAAPCRKYEEIDPPDLDEFVYTTDSTYSRKQLSRMEHLILNALRFRMMAPTINQFLSLFMAIQAVCPLTQNLAMVSTPPSLWADGLTDVDPFCLLLVHRRVEPAGSGRDAALPPVPPGGRRLQPGLLHRQQTPLGTFVLLLRCSATGACSTVVA